MTTRRPLPPDSFEVLTPRFGFPISKVEDVQGADSISFDQVKAEVKLAAERQAMEDLTKEVRAKASIAVKEDSLRDFRL